MDNNDNIEYCTCGDDVDVLIESLEPPIARCCECNKLVKD